MILMGPFSVDVDDDDDDDDVLMKIHTKATEDAKYLFFGAMC